MESQSLGFGIALLTSLSLPAALADVDIGFQPICADVTWTASAPIDTMLLDAENIYCPPHLSADGGCDNGVHNHATFSPSTKGPYCRSRSVVAMVGSGFYLPLYVTHFSIRTSDGNRITDCNPASYLPWGLATADVEKVGIHVDVAQKQCTITAIGFANVTSAAA